MMSFIMPRWHRRGETLGYPLHQLCPRRYGSRLNSSRKSTPIISNPKTATLEFLPVRDADLDLGKQHLANRLAALLAHRRRRYAAPFGVRKIGRNQVAIEDTRVLSNSEQAGSTSSAIRSGP